MSEIDCHPHIAIGNFLDHPLYLSLGNFNYHSNFVTTEHIVWRDDCSSTPAIINIRSAIHTAIESKLLDQEKPDLSLLKELGSDIHSKYSIKSWNEQANYSIAHEMWQRYVAIVGELEVGYFQYWALEQIGTFLIQTHPELLTKREKEISELFTWSKPQGITQD